MGNTIENPIQKFQREGLCQATGCQGLGRIDKIARKFGDIDYEFRMSVSNMMDIADGLEDGAEKAVCKMYIKYGNEVIKRGSFFFVDEYKRLQRLSHRHKMSRRKLEEMKMKISILTSFLEGYNYYDEIASGWDAGDYVTIHPNTD